MRQALQFFKAIWLAVVSVALLPVAVGAQCESGNCNSGPVSRVGWRGQWYVLQTENFQICCERSETGAAELANLAEKLRDELESKWLGNSSKDEWRPYCQIYLHASKRSYLTAVGAGSEHTVGSSLVRVDNGHIVSRRIDLLGDQQDFLTAALPHELTHVVLRDRFTSASPPRWADEGMATMADTAAKQGRHHIDLMKAISDGTAFRAGNLLAMDDYPSLNRYGAFYGESVSLTEYLVNRGTPELFVQFIGWAKIEGYDAALQRCYGIAGAHELDREWRESLNPIQLAVSGAH